MKIDEAIVSLKTQLNRLDTASMKMEQHEKELFTKCIEAKAKGDDVRASLYASECLEVRKLMKLLLKSKLALEWVLLRLETVEEFGDITAMGGPIAVITALRKQLGGIVPEVSYELARIEDKLSKMMVEVGETSSQRLDLELVNSEAQKILTEASTLAEKKLRQKLPEIEEAEKKNLQFSDELILKIEIPYRLVKALQKSLARIPTQYMDEPLMLLLSTLDNAMEEAEEQVVR